MSHLAAKPPDFSTGFWKEFRLRYPRPAVYLTAGAAYAALFIVLAISLNDWDSGQPWMLALGLACTAGLATLPAILAARAFTSPAWRGRARAALAGASGREAAGRFLRAEILKVLVAPGLVAALLAPLYLAQGAWSADFSWASGLPMGILLWLDVLAALLLAGVAGAIVGLTVRRRGWRLDLAALLLVLGLAAPRFIVTSGDYTGISDSKEISLTALTVCAAVDGLLCLLMAWPLFLRLPRMMLKRLAEPEPREISDDQALADAPEGFGLGIAFWALLRWRFRRDPLWRAERRSFWSAKRIAIWWAVAVLAMLGSLVAVWFPVVAERFLDNSWFLPFAFAGNLLGHLSVWAAPAIVAVGLNAERASGALDSMLLTPVAPLRLAAAKLMGRCWHLLLAAAVLGALTSFCCCGAARDWMTTMVRPTGYWMEKSPSMEEMPSLGLSGVGFLLGALARVLLTLLSVLAWGALGMYCAARWRSLVAALTGAYGLAILLWLLLSFPNLYSLYGYFNGGYGRWDGPGAMFTIAWLVLQTLILGVVLRVFLVGAARQLALQRWE